MRLKFFQTTGTQNVSFKTFDRIKSEEKTKYLIINIYNTKL